MVVAVFALCASCTGAGSTTSTVTPPAAAATKGARLDITSLSASLLTLSDMPAGWTAGTNDSTTNDSQVCNKAGYKINAPDNAAVTFQRSDAGPFFAEGLERTTDADASAFIKSLREAASSCQEWTEAAATGEANTWQVAALPSTSYGDETLAFRLTSGPTVLGPLEIDLVFVRYGPVIMYLANAVVGYTGVDTSQPALWAKNADAKLHALNPGPP